MSASVWSGRGQDAADSGCGGRSEGSERKPWLAGDAAVTGDQPRVRGGFSAFVWLYWERVLPTRRGLSKAFLGGAGVCMSGHSAPLTCRAGGGLRRRGCAPGGGLGCHGELVASFLWNVGRMSGSHLTSAHTLMRGARMGRVDGLGLEVGLASLRGLIAACRQAPGGCLGFKMAGLPGSWGSPQGAQPSRMRSVGRVLWLLAGLLDGAVIGMREWLLRPEPGPCSPRTAAFQG